MRKEPFSRISPLEGRCRRFIEKFWEILCAVYYCSLPEKITNRVSQRGEAIYLWIIRVFALIKQIKMDVYRIEGISREGESSLTSLYFGEEASLAYFSSLAYGGTPRIERVRRVYIWDIFRKIKSISNSADLVLVMVNKFFTRFLMKQGYFIIPEWVSQTLDISKPLEDTWRNLSRNEREYLRKIKACIKRFRYSYEIRYDMDMLEYFYHKIYVPFTLQRYGKLAELASLSSMRRAFRRGGLLMVKEGDTYLGGVLFIIARGEIFHIFRWGVASGDQEYLKRGVGGALYYFSIMWTKQQGYKQVDFGGSRAFLNNGILRYKKKWGATVSNNRWLTSTFGLQLLDFTDGVRDFLSNNPFIFADGNNLSGLVLAHQTHPVAEDQLKRFFQIYCISGLEGLTIISSSGFAKDAWNLGTEKLHKKVTLVVRSEDRSLNLAIDGSQPTFALISAEGRR